MCSRSSAVRGIVGPRSPVPVYTCPRGIGLVLDELLLPAAGALTRSRRGVLVRAPARPPSRRFLGGYAEIAMETDISSHHYI